jgi:hypothetical protein
MQQIIILKNNDVLRLLSHTWAEVCVSFRVNDHELIHEEPEPKSGAGARFLLPRPVG